MSIITEYRSVFAWGWEGGGERQEAAIERGTRKLLGVINMLVMVMFFTGVYICQLYTLNMCNLLYTNCTSMKLLKLSRKIVLYPKSDNQRLLQTLSYLMWVCFQYEVGLDPMLLKLFDKSLIFINCLKVFLFRNLISSFKINKAILLEYHVIMLVSFLLKLLLFAQLKAF